MLPGLPAGRWKATPVAVKIIEHYGVDAQASSGSRRISAQREMLFAGTIQHPNVVSAVAGLQDPA